MADFTFSCPLCGKHLRVESEWAGMEIECPNCNQTITVPDEKIPSVDLIPEDSVKCPCCGKVVKKGATFCRWCRKIIPASDPGLGNYSAPLQITKLICGVKAASESKFSFKQMVYMGIACILWPYLTNLFIIPFFIILCLTNERHKHDIFLFQFWKLFMMSVLGYVLISCIAAIIALF